MRLPVRPSSFAATLALLLLAGGPWSSLHAQRPIDLYRAKPGSARSALPAAASDGGAGSSLTARNAPIRPDPKLTPGDTLEVTLEDIKTPGYSSRVRNVPIEVKREVYAAYGIAHWNKGEYEVDHLIPLSLGGSNSKRNLWPQSYLTQPWNAHVKDALEYRLLTLVRAGKVDMKTAQTEMASDWIAAYKKYISPEPSRQHAAGQGLPTSADRNPDVNTPSAVGPTMPTAATTNSQPQQGKVWVNTKSGVYHGPNSRYFGKTKEGKFLSEAQALAAGYHADASER
jgi:hypothetical protein